MSNHSKYSKIQDISISPSNEKDFPLTERINPQFTKIKKIPIASKIPVAPKKYEKLHKSTFAKIDLLDPKN